ncbi:unnamed protein product [Heterobilharzia americana]|nr:unnamed protein product [Heterobilharzia americana]
MLLSATMSKEILSTAQSIVNDCSPIVIKNDESLLNGTKQFYIIVVSKAIKLDLLIKVLHKMNGKQIVVFMHSVRKALNVYRKLVGLRFSVSCVYNRMNREERRRIMNEYRSGKVPILLSTYPLARSINVPQVSLIVNYELSCSYKKYVHRISRGHNCGDMRKAISFITESGIEVVKDYQQYLNTEILELTNGIDEFLQQL